MFGRENKGFEGPESCAKPQSPGFFQFKEDGDIWAAWAAISGPSGFGALRQERVAANMFFGLLGERLQDLKASVSLRLSFFGACLTPNTKTTSGHAPHREPGP